MYYHMLLFTTFTKNHPLFGSNAWFNFGYSFIVAIAFIIVMNIAFAVISQVLDTRKKKKLNAQKSAILSAYKLKVEEIKAD